MRKSSTQNLVELFRRNGYFRIPDDGRIDKGSKRYKKGYEVRLVASDEIELAKIRSMLKRAGLKSGSPFRKANQYVQPVYGKEAFEKFNEWIEQYPDR